MSTMYDSPRFARRASALALFVSRSYARVASLTGLLALCAAAACGGHMREGSGRAIPMDIDARDIVPQGHGPLQLPEPLALPYAKAHPYMASHGVSSMHVDSFTTNAYPYPGPIGRSSEVSSRSMGFLGGECPTINFDKQGRIVTVCVRRRTPWLLLIDPNSLHVLARHPLPKRSVPLLRVRKAMSDTSGGAYFYLDQHDRAVVGTSAGTIDIIGVRTVGDEQVFEQIESIDLRRELLLADGTFDKITAVMPDFENNLWFVGRYGTVGVVTPKRAVHVDRLDGEEIENSFSVGPEGAYIVSDHALYRFGLDAGQNPKVAWREQYDRGSQRKVGQINQGSGTTPTLLGEDYVAITDNAEPRMSVLVYKRGKDLESQRLVCKMPVFQPHQSATENTLIGHGRSLVVENNAGYDLFLTMRGGKTSAPGLTRIDVRPDESGCDVVWESKEISQTTVPKLSTATGLIYLYTKLSNAPGGADAYYFTALDFKTGKTVFRVLAGTGVRYDNNWAAISLAPDGTAYVGVLNGLIRVRDRAIPEVGSASYVGSPSLSVF
jgi:hypothetical protein